MDQIEPNQIKSNRIVLNMVQLLKMKIKKIKEQNNQWRMVVKVGMAMMLMVVVQ